MDGARAVGVLSALAGSIDQVKEAQDVANRGLAQGSYILNVYNQKNNNLQAELEKRKKAFKEATIELGERLNPALLKSTKLLTYIVKSAPTILNFFKEWGPLMLKLVAVIAAYNVGLAITARLKQFLGGLSLKEAIDMRTNLALTSANTVGTYAYAAAVNVLTLNFKRAGQAMKGMWATMRNNPLGWILTAITAVTFALYKYKEWLDKGKSAMDAFRVTVDSISEATKSYTEEIIREKTQLTHLVNAATDANTTAEDRLSIIQKIKSEYPQLLAYINEEKISNEELIAVQKELNRMYSEQLKLAAIKGKAKAYENKITESMQRVMDIDAEIAQLNTKITTLTKGSKDYDRLQEIKKEKQQLETLITSYTNANKKLAEEASKIQQKIDFANSLPGMENQINNYTKLIEEATEHLREAREQDNKDAIEFYSNKIAEVTEQITQLNKLIVSKKNPKIYSLMVDKENLEKALEINPENKEFTEQLAAINAEITKLQRIDELTKKFYELKKALSDITITGDKKKSLSTELAGIEKELTSLGINPKKLIKDKDTDGTSDTYTPTGGNDKSDPGKEKIKAIEAQLQLEINALKQYRNEGVITEKEYNKAVEQLTLESYDKKLQIKELEKEQLAGIEQQRFDLIYKMQQESDKDLLQELQKSRDDALMEMEARKNAELEKLQDEFENREMYAILSKQVEAKYAEERKGIALDYGVAVENAEFAIARNQVEAIKKSGEDIVAADKAVLAKRAEAMKEFAKMKEALEKLYNPNNFDNRKKAEIEYVTTQHNTKNDKGERLLSDEAYEKALAEIDKKYADERYRARQQAGIASLKEQLEQEQAIIEQAHADGMMKEWEYQEALLKLRVDYIAKYIDMYASEVGNLVDALKQGEYASMFSTCTKSNGRHPDCNRSKTALRFSVATS